MRIDAHQHFWRYDSAELGWIDDSLAALRRDFLPEHLAPLLAANGFDGCVAVQARQSLAETDFLLDLAGRHRFILGVVGWVDLCAPEVRETLERYRAQPKLVGLRHVLQDEPEDLFMLRADFARGLSVAEELGLPYDLLIHPRHLPIAAQLVGRFPGLRFVLDHLAKPDIRNGEIENWRRQLGKIASFPNVLCKLSGLVTEAHWRSWTREQVRPYLDVAYDVFGAARLMIGSDWPVCSVAADYARTMDLVKEYLEGRPAAEQAAVLGGNAQRFWGLREEETSS